MAFEPYVGNFRYQEVGAVGSMSVVKGGLVRFDLTTGYIEPGVAASAVQYGVCMSATQTASATNGATKILVVPFESGQVWKVDTTGDMAQTYVGTIVSVTDAVSMDEDDTGNTPLFETVGYVGALTDRKGLYTPHMANFTAIGV